MSTGIKELMKPGFDERCDPDIYAFGEPVATIAGGSAKLIDRFVKELAEFSGQPVDWHYIGGRAFVRTTGDRHKVLDALIDMKLNIDPVSSSARPFGKITDAKASPADD